MINQKHFNHFNLNELIWNDYFRKWVLSPDEESDNFWNIWINANPEKSEVVNDAVRIIEFLTVKDIAFSDEAITIEIQKILDKINNQ